jgi:glycosyltransferase involved in cell wall biosynthesis
MKSPSLPKIAYVTENGKIPGFTANSVGVIKICYNMAKQGHKVDLLIPDGHQSNVSSSVWEFYNVEPIFNIHYIKTFKWMGKFSVLIFFIKSAFFIFSNKIESVNSRSLIFSCLIGLIGKPIIFESHNYAKFKKSIFRHIWIFLVKSNLYKASMISTTTVGKQSYITHGIKSSKIIVLPNASDLELFKNQPEKTELRHILNLSLDQKIICFCGSLYPGRGIDEVIYSIEKTPDAYFLIVGGPENDVQYYKKIVAAKGLKNCLFTGHIPQKKVPAYLMASDILLMPYTNKTAHPYMSPMKMFDYIATGKAIIATNYPVVQEILTEGETAIFVKPDNEKDLHKAILKLLKSKTLYENLCKNTLKMRKNYSWALRAEKMVEHHQKNLGTTH